MLPSTFRTVQSLVARVIRIPDAKNDDQPKFDARECSLIITHLKFGVDRHLAAHCAASAGALRERPAQYGHSSPEPPHMTILEATDPTHREAPRPDQTLSEGSAGKLWRVRATPDLSG